MFQTVRPNDPTDEPWTQTGHPTADQNVLHATRRYYLHKVSRNIFLSNVKTQPFSCFAGRFMVAKTNVIVLWSFSCLKFGHPAENMPKIGPTNHKLSFLIFFFSASSSKKIIGSEHSLTKEGAFSDEKFPKQGQGFRVNFVCFTKMTWISFIHTHRFIVGAQHNT